MKQLLTVIIFCFVGNVCMAQELALKSLEELYELMNTNDSSCTELERLTGISIPGEICGLIQNAELVNEFDLGFLGLQAISYEVLLRQYKNKSENLSFFDSWGIDDSFRVNGFQMNGFTFTVEFGLEGELNSPKEVYSVNHWVPVFSFEGNYLLANLDSKSEYKGVVFVDAEGFAFVFAPDFRSHIEDLLEGFKDGRYIIRQNNLVFPSYWHLRQQLKSGEIKMDEYGDVY